MTRQEAGRLGGLATHRRHGSAHMAAIGRMGFRGLVDRYNGDARAAREHLIAAGKIVHRNRQADYWKEVLSRRESTLTYDAWEIEQRVMAVRAEARERGAAIITEAAD